MLRFALLGFALVTMCVVMGESEPVPEEVMCEFNGRFFKVGQKTYEGCERCKCRKNGLMKCTENTDCCLYTDKKGRTKRAYPGDSFNDGCNQCMCGENDMTACTLMGCPHKCYYKNWDMVPGYASKGKINAYDEEEGCPKQCKCKVKNGQATLSCKSECIAF